MDRRFSHVLIDHICQREPLLRGLLSLCFVVFVLLFVSLRVVERGSATYVITLVDLMSVVGIGAIAGVLLVVCRRRREE